MKKLIALIGAVATAFGLYAADSFSISFEGAESAKGVDASAMTFTPPSPDWKWDGDTLNIKAYGDGEMLPYGTGALARRDSSFVGEGDNDNYLTLETGTNALTRAVGGNVFLDQLVKFTGFEEYQTNVAAGTKIAVWMSAIETEGTPQIGTPQIGTPAQGVEGEDGYVPASDDYQPASEDYQPASDDYIAGETNLYITVGKADIMGNAEPIALKIDGTFKLDTWYRLTIKSIGNVFGESQEVAPRAGFIVYINGVQAKSLDSEAKTLIATVKEMTSEAQGFMADGALFPAIDTTDATFATVGYQGIGAIDDIILDDQGPAFAQATDVKIIFPLDAEDNPSVEVDYIDVGGVHMTYPCAVPAGTLITVYFKAVDGKKIMSNLQPQQLTVTASNFTIDISDVVVEDVVAKKNGTVDLAASEIADALAALNENDRIAFVAACEVWEEGAESFTYSFAPNTTITKTAAGWDVYVGNYDDGGECGGTFECKADIANGFVLNVEIEDDTGDLGGTFAFAGNIAGTLKTAFGVNDSIEATLTGAGKVITMDGSLDAILDGEGNAVTAVEGPEAGWYTYALATEPTEPTTGFMVIIAGETEGEVYETLAAAVEAAPAGATIKLLSDETAVAGKCEITKNITLDLNGKTLARDNNAATLFVIKDATLTINGATPGSALVGRLNVGDSVYNGGVRTDHWDGKLVINGGTYSVGNGQTVIHVNGDCLDAAVTINDATLTSPTDNGVQFNGKGTFAINNSTINGATAVYIKAGTLTIDKDSKINATAKTWTAPVANHNGSNPTGDAIVMDSITGYQGAISLTVADGATVTKVAEDAATIRETITDATDSTTVKIDAPTIGGIALTEAFLAKVANGSAQLPGYVATIGTVPYPTLAAAFAAAKNDDTVEMLADVSLAANEKVVIMDKAVTLAGAFTVTAAGRAFNVQKGGTLTISSETTVIGTGKPATIFLWPYDFDSRALTSDDAAHYGKAKLVVNGTVKYTTTGNEGAIASNGNDSIAESEGVDVIINGTVINECDSALYLPGKGTCTVNDGAYIEGTYAGIQMKAVTLTVNGGTIKATGEDQTPTAPWADGANPSGCAIQMEGNTAYAGGINLTVNGGTIWSVNAKAIYAYGAQEKFGTISIAGGTIKGNTGVFLLDQGMNKAIVPGSSKAQFNQDVTDFCEEGYETVKLESAEFYTVRAKQTDPIPPLPAEPTADDVNTKVDAAKFADSTVKTMIGGDPAKYTAFKTWADTVTGGQAAVVASAHAADSYLLGQTTLLENAPVSKIKTIAKTSDTALTLTFEIKDGDNAVTVAQTAADYVKTLVQCNEKVDFGNGTKIDATVTVTISGTTLNAAVTLPANKPAAFMKVAK